MRAAVRDLTSDRFLGQSRPDQDRQGRREGLEEAEELAPGPVMAVLVQQLARCTPRAEVLQSHFHS